MLANCLSFSLFVVCYHPEYYCCCQYTVSAVNNVWAGDLQESNQILKGKHRCQNLHHTSIAVRQKVEQTGRYELGLNQTKCGRLQCNCCAMQLCLTNSVYTQGCLFLCLTQSQINYRTLCFFFYEFSTHHLNIFSITPNCLN